MNHITNEEAQRRGILINNRTPLVREYAREAHVGIDAAVKIFSDFSHATNIDQKALSKALRHKEREPALALAP